MCAAVCVILCFAVCVVLCVTPSSRAIASYIQIRSTRSVGVCVAVCVDVQLNV